MPQGRQKKKIGPRLFSVEKPGDGLPVFLKSAVNTGELPLCIWEGSQNDFVCLGIGLEQLSNEGKIEPKGDSQN